MNYQHVRECLKISITIAGDEASGTTAYINIMYENGECFLSQTCSLADGVLGHWGIHLDNGRKLFFSLDATNFTSTTEELVRHLTSLIKSFVSFNLRDGQVAGLCVRYVLVHVVDTLLVCLFVGASVDIELAPNVN